MEAKVDQALGDIQLANAGLFFQRTNIENAFVRYATIATGVEHRVGVFQSGSDVVGVRIAFWLACFSPSAPIMRIYIQLIGKMDALPNGAAETAPRRVSIPSICTTLWPGTNGASALSRR